MIVRCVIVNLRVRHKMEQKRFTYGAQVFINELKKAGIGYATRHEMDYCPDCAGAGCGCQCGTGIVEFLIVEYTPEEQCNHCPDCGYCRGAFPCPREN